IQYILRQMYSVVNLSYMGLSREMEFHADSIAASVSGSLPLITSLRRLDMANECYNTVLNQLDQMVAENLKSENIYSSHSFMMISNAEELGLPVINELPEINKDSFRLYNQSKLVYKDQWASHPSTEDRETHLNKLNIKSENINGIAWLVFKNPNQLQKEMTEFLYKNVTFTGTPCDLSNEEFKLRINEKRKKYQLHKEYNGFYENRNISFFDPLKVDEELKKLHFNDHKEIFTNENKNVIYQIEGLKQDIFSLEAINKKELKVKTFEYEGQKFKQADAGEILKRLQIDLKNKEKDIEILEISILNFFLQKAKEKNSSEELINTYTISCAIFKQSEIDLEYHRDVINLIIPIYNEALPIEEVNSIMRNVKHKEEFIKKRLEQMLEDIMIKEFLDENKTELLKKYLSKKWHYYNQSEFDNEALELFSESMGIYYYIVTELSFKIKKELLDKQMSYL
ncbi:MAG: hypothetical protein M3Q58_01415, partial [Bacteroidota bacterium]|nr:hypothetical protein [Bacteroidota bacterium]